jgi:hypothetical protein
VTAGSICSRSRCARSLHCSVPIVAERMLLCNEMKITKVYLMNLIVSQSRIVSQFHVVRRDRLLSPASIKVVINNVAQLIGSPQTSNQAETVPIDRLADELAPKLARKSISRSRFALCGAKREKSTV